ncbi:unnamed protein product [Agarophyton chilense]
MRLDKTITKPPRRRIISIDESHRMRFGVQFPSRHQNMGAILAVVRKFYIIFGYETNGKKNQHNFGWRKYQTMESSGRNIFLEAEVPYVERITSHFGTKDELIFKVKQGILKDIIIELLTKREESLQQMERICPFKFDADKKQYVVAIKKGIHFRMTIGNVAIGIFFMKAYSVSHFMVCVDICFKTIQEKDILVFEQKNHFSALVYDIKSTGGICGPPPGFQMLTAVTEMDDVAQSNTFDTDEMSVRKFMLGISSQTLEGFFNLSDWDKREVLVTMESLVLSSYEHISNLTAE